MSCNPNGAPPVVMNMEFMTMVSTKMKGTVISCGTASPEVVEFFDKAISLAGDLDFRQCLWEWLV